MGDWGDDFIAGDQGTDTLIGGGGADTFHSSATSGLDYIADFHRAQGDQLNLLAGSQYTVKQVGADIVVDIVGGAKVVVQGVQLASLDAGWITVG
jgi:Ca2+-binding RTX toxin-like protein